MNEEKWETNVRGKYKLEQWKHMKEIRCRNLQTSEGLEWQNMESKCGLKGRRSQELETNVISNLERFQSDNHGDLLHRIIVVSATVNWVLTGLCAPGIQRHGFWR